MDKFVKNIDNFEADNEAVKLCVRRFDETLSLKANKGELATILSKLENNFISNHLWENIEKKYQKMEN